MTAAPARTPSRLPLRLPVLADVEPRAAFHASVRSMRAGGPSGPGRAGRGFACEVGRRPRMGDGPFALRPGGDNPGEAGISRCADCPGPDLGRCVAPRGRGPRHRRRARARGHGPGAVRDPAMPWAPGQGARVWRQRRAA